MADEGSEKISSTVFYMVEHRMPSSIFTTESMKANDESQIQDPWMSSCKKQKEKQYLPNGNL
jgi:hypothetical protein